MRSLTLSPEVFRSLARDIAEFTADYLHDLPQLPSFPRDVHGAEVERLFGGDVPVDGMGAEAFRQLSDVYANTRPASPRFFGYVFGSGEPIASIGAFAGSVLHPNATAWRSSPSAITIEKTVVRWLAEAIGCQGFSGSLTLGGSSANLMGLCMAREAKAPANDAGVRGGVIYTSAEAHMSIAKAAALLGIGHASVRKIPVDADFRMMVEALRDAIDNDLRDGKQPIAVVASAGTTLTGSIDPLNDIADLCERYGLWLHIDGAYGALAALAIPNQLEGLNRADSLSLDPHKWLYQPTGCGCLLYKDPSSARRAFSHSGDYARSLTQDPIEGFCFFEESIELSRPFRALSLWLSLRYHGLRAFLQSIQEDLRLAQVLADAIDAEPRLQRLAPVALSAVCFRFVASERDLDVLNQRILARVIQRGRVYISNGSVNGEFCLRACIVNHRTTEDDVRAVVSEVLAAAEDVKAAK